MNGCQFANYRSRITSYQLRTNMQRFLITAANCTWLALLLIGLPAAASAQFWGWRISPAATEQRLVLCGLAFATAGNTIAALFWFKGRKERKLCRLWAAIFGVLLLAYWMFIRDWINFRWLQNALLWVQKHF